MQNIRANALLQKKDDDDYVKITFAVFLRTPMELGDLANTILTFIGNIIIGVCFIFRGLHPSLLVGEFHQLLGSLVLFVANLVGCRQIGARQEFAKISLL